MAKITRPSESALQGGAQISLGTAAQAGAGTIALGQAQTQRGNASVTRVGAMAQEVSNLVSAEGRRYFEESKRAHQTGMLSNAITSATEEYQTRQKERFQQVVDKDGNPTFMTMADDVGNIGKDIMNRLSGKILDREVQARFRNDFGNYVSNQKVTALNVARKQQIDYTRNSLNRGLDALMDQAHSDDLGNVASYEQQAIQLLDDAFAAGAVTAEEHGSRIANFQENSRVGSISRMIIDSTADAGSLLTELDATELGVSEENRQKLMRKLDAKLASDAVAVDKANKLEEQQRKYKEALLIQELENRIDADALREDELLEFEDSMDPLSFSKLKGKFIRSREKQSEESKDLDELSDKLAKNEDLSNISSSLINKHYGQVVDDAAATQGGPLSMVQKAEVAAMYKAKVPGFTRELYAKILYGNPEEVKDAVSAYTFMQERNPRVIGTQGAEQKAQSIADMVGHLVSVGGVSPVNAINQAKERILNAKDADLIERKQTFFKEFIDNEGTLSSINIKETLADRLGVENIFFVNKDVDDQPAENYRNLVRDAYITHGDADIALDVAAKKMEKVHGVSKFNKEEIYMFLPPEQIYSDIPLEGMRRSFDREINLKYPDLPSENVRIFSDKRTSQDGSYGVITTQDIDGIATELPLIDPITGELERWAPDVSTSLTDQAVIENERQQAFIDEARKERDN